MPLYTPQAVKIYKSGVAAPLTGSTNETALGTISIPANSVGPNGVIRITTTWTSTNNANTKTVRIRFGGISGTQMLNSTGLTSTTGAHVQRLIHNRNSTSSQILSFGLSSLNSFTTGAPPTTAFDTSAAFDISITAQLATSTDTVTLEGYLVEIIYGA